MILVQQSPPPPELLDDTRDNGAGLDPSLTRSTNLLVEGKSFLNIVNAVNMNSHILGNFS